MQIVETMCDSCGGASEVTHHNFTESGLIYDIDLCQACYERDVEPFLTILRSKGRVTDQGAIVPTPEPGKRWAWGSHPPRRCTLCDFEGRAHALAAHAKSEHNAGLSVVLGGPVKSVCPECGYKMGGKQGVATHMHNEHGHAFPKALQEATHEQVSS